MRRIPRSFFNSAFSRRKAATSASRASEDGAGDGATAARRPRGRLDPAARIQFRSVSGWIPRSAAICLIVASGRDSYSATASA
ncbi:hypothetical protein OG445_46550 (plasmid) [Streptomyces sp. NBC_01462]|nr:hypothetical protein [Streptomyces sp. NBC_01462]